MTDQSEDPIQAIVDRTGLSHVQAATIAAQQREAELAAARAAEGRSATNTEWGRPTVIVPPTINSRRSSGTRPVWERRPPEPVCPYCNGGGYTLEALPYWHPRRGQLTPCVCKLEEIAAKDAQILRDLADELLRYRACRLDTYGLDRPIEEDVVWGDRVLGKAEQRKVLRIAHGAASRYVAAPQGWLFLYGPPGGGKTRLAAAIANELAERRMRTTYASTPGLIAYIQAGFDDNSVHRRRLALQRVPVLVIDDLGTEHITDFSRAELGDLINQRYNRELATVFTSNEWYDTLPVRIADRIAEMAEVIYLTVSSYRRLSKKGRP